ncbi:Cupin 2 conserved barrel domain protein [Isosphaera pallida ATCC 43644]|uniref:Cupin 2 conserved barrel domain protein n=1 Tax=Isosphaera pallida (strain ATCC 43644 / DSM 9630 / IS1B) TaxID=575540 RepID=E8R447_ISOPI|nr:cupin domain-containing protein [Isosphaera pallida]ADV61634.1 Cupin 2 conserved barrel domain protein [Isosphaera pallida ATCC 43644]
MKRDPELRASPDSPTRPMFITAGSGLKRPLFPGVELTINAGERLMLSVVTFEADAVVPTHSHPHEQGGYLVSGQLEFTIGNETRLLKPGDQWLIPGGTPHRVRAIGGPAVAVDVFTPPREDYLA